MTIELKPCPFCGSEAAPPDGNNHTWCSETSCGSDAYLSVEAWNRRTEPGKPESGVLAVKVKPLEWEYHERPMMTYVISDERGVSYHINQAFGSDSYYFATVRHDGKILYDGDDLPSSKAAAQADYEQRIMSAFTTPPQPVAALHAEPCEPVGYVTKNELTNLSLGASCVDLFGKVVPKGFEMVPLYAYALCTGPIVTDAMIAAAKSAYWHEVHNGSGYSDKCYEAAIRAALTTPPQPIEAQGDKRGELIKQAYLEGWENAKSADRGETPEEEWFYSETYHDALRIEGTK